MQQLVLRLFPNVMVEYQFTNRGNTAFPKGFATELKSMVNALSDLKFTKDEIRFLDQTCPFFSQDYLEWLSRFSPNPNYVTISQNGGDLKVKVTGPWYQTIYWEMPLMAMISELYFEKTGQKPEPGWEQKAWEKGRLLKSEGCTFSDFGLRRRFSSTVHEGVIQALLPHKKLPGDDGGFTGTSNVYLAYKYGLAPVGTMAHELAMVFAVIYGFKSANRKVMDLWLEEFGDKLAVVLTDTFTTDVFLRDFTLEYAKQFSGVRQDSGNPEGYADKIIAHYHRLGIDPKTKFIVFSDGLTAQKAVEVKQYCSGKIPCTFGIGTSLTNDVGAVPLNMVIKVAKVKVPGRFWTNTVKLSDSPGKITGEKRTAAIAKRILVI